MGDRKLLCSHADRHMQYRDVADPKQVREQLLALWAHVDFLFNI